MAAPLSPFAKRALLARMTPPTIWRDPYRVRAYEADAAGLASVQTICNYFQETAGYHAAALGVSAPDLLRSGLTWVQTRLRVQVARRPAWLEDVAVETWPSGDNGRTATREYYLLGADGAVLARGVSTWAVLDVQRRRPVRIPDAIHHLVLPERPPALPPGAEPPGALEGPAGAAEFRVRRSDLDLNGHVNNVRYIEWLAEATPPEGFDLAAFDLAYRAEVFLGEAIEVLTAEQPPAEGARVFRHSVRAAGKEAARAETRWRPTSGM